MHWIIVTLIMTAAFIVNVLMTPNCDHYWEDKGKGNIRCTKCKKKLRKFA
jgi:hypothetical protein